MKIYMNRPIKADSINRIPDFRTFLLFTLVLVFASCKSQKNSAADNNSDSDKVVLNKLLTDYHDVSNFEKTMVIRDEKALTKFFTSVNRTRKPGLPMPQIDFSKNMLVVHFFRFTEQKDELGLSVMEQTDSTILLQEQESPQLDSSATLKILPFGIFELPITTKKILVK